MAISRLVFVLVVSIVQIYAVNVPVFLWGDLPKTGLNSNPLSTVPTSKFNEIVQEELQEDPFTVIFIEENFSVEDFSQKKSDGETSFPYLHSVIGNALYLPSVSNPLGVIYKLADPEKVDHVKLTENGLSAEIESENGKFLFINLKDAREGESRTDLLYRHNNFMADMFTKLQERYNKVVAIYTAHYPSWTVSETHSRVRRQANSPSNDTTINEYMYSGILLNIKNTLVDNIGLIGPIGAETSVDDTLLTQNTTLKYEGHDITFSFMSKGGYWFIESLTMKTSNNETVFSPLSDVYALNNFSYACGQNVTYFNHYNGTPYNLTFQSFRIQPFFITNDTNLTFGDPFYCVGFFSAPIWAGLFVTFCLLAITFYGIMMMMDIRTMDRFDDPKGKTITINAVE